MTTTSISTQGITVTVANSGGTPVSITGHVGITGIGSGTAKKIDITTMASTRKEYRQGLLDNGSCKISFVRNLDDAGQAELLSMEGLQATRQFVIVLPQGTLKTATFSAFVESFTTDMGTDDKVIGECTICITGNVAWS